MNNERTTAVTGRPMCRQQIQDYTPKLFAITVYSPIHEPKALQNLKTRHYW